MQIVLDASLLVALVLREPHAERIEDLIRRWDEEGAVLNAPLLTHHEVAAVELRRHSAYDAAYVVLADRLDAELWTLDGPLARNARDHHRLTLVD